MKIALLPTAALLLLSNTVSSQINFLRTDLQKIASSVNAKVGIAILDFNSGDTLTVNNIYPYPMQSVYKFHLALAVLKKVDARELKLSQPIEIRAEQLHQNTWSPLRDEFPVGDVSLPLSYILKKTVAFSDNNGCDILFNLVGGTNSVDQTIKSLNIENINIAKTELEMHTNYEAQFENWCYPISAVLLLRKLYNGEILLPTTQQYLTELMEQSTTGTERIKGLLPKETIVAHKTGYSGVNEQGITAATNDIGVIYFPNGRKVGIAVFVADSHEDLKTNEKIIAQISKKVWDWYSVK